MFEDILFRINAEDYSDRSELYPIFEQIIKIEPDIEDPGFFYFYGNTLKSKGDENSAYLAFKKAYDFNNKYPQNEFICYLINKEIGSYEYFERGNNAPNLEQKKVAYYNAKFHLKKALEYYNYYNENDEESDVLKEIIKRCDDISDNNEESNLSEQDSTKKNSRCFIATAVYGSENSVEVISLRSFRDDYLLQSTIGQLIVKIYYRYSPYVAKFISNREILKTFIRKNLLDPLIKKLEKKT